MNDNQLIERQGDHKNLICYRKAELIYDITYHFAHAAFFKGDRTIVQMVQAARSGKQNIVEGNADMNTSMEMSIKLLNVAKGSLKELLSDYEDYLRVNQCRQWEESSVEFEAMRKLGKSADNTYILSIAKTRSLDVVANMAIILIKQEDFLLHKLLESVSSRFIKEGGFKEKMYRVRMAQRREQYSDE